MVCQLVLVCSIMKLGVGRLWVCYWCLVVFLFIVSVDVSMLLLVYGMLNCLSRFWIVLFLLKWLCSEIIMWLNFCLVRLVMVCRFGLNGCVLMLCVCSVVSMLLLDISEILCLVEWLFMSMFILLRDFGLIVGFGINGLVVMLWCFCLDL